MQIARYEDNLVALHQDLDASQQQYKDCHKQLLEAVQKQNDLRMQVKKAKGIGYLCNPTQLCRKAKFWVYKLNCHREFCRPD